MYGAIGVVVLVLLVLGYKQFKPTGDMMPDVKTIQRDIAERKAKGIPEPSHSDLPTAKDEANIRNWIKTHGGNAAGGR